jgi:preprotein translocase subunit SecB
MPKLEKAIADHQKLFKQIIDNIQLVKVQLAEHIFQKYSDFIKTKEHKVNIKAAKGTYQFVDDKLIIRQITTIKAVEAEKEIFQAKYDYELCFSIKDKTILEQSLTDDKASDAFLDTNILKIIVPYLRVEMQNDTLKAGLPPLTLPLWK